ncbi:unnamed protein product [Amoebophrya sp. A120]|nr:unnamed protein product [Amoebophrya sp. A120]|eukprot:GSA120T00024944001.1
MTSFSSRSSRGVGSLAGRTGDSLGSDARFHSPLFEHPALGPTAAPPAATSHHYTDGSGKVMWGSTTSGKSHNIGLFAKAPPVVGASSVHVTARDGEHASQELHAGPMIAATEAGSANGTTSNQHNDQAHHPLPEREAPAGPPAPSIRKTTAQLLYEKQQAAQLAEQEEINQRRGGRLATGQQRTSGPQRGAGVAAAFGGRSCTQHDVEQTINQHSGSFPALQHPRRLNSQPRRGVGVAASQPQSACNSRRGSGASLAAAKPGYYSNHSTPGPRGNIGPNRAASQQPHHAYSNFRASSNSGAASASLKRPGGSSSAGGGGPLYNDEDSQFSRSQNNTPAAKRPRRPEPLLRRRPVEEQVLQFHTLHANGGDVHLPTLVDEGEVFVEGQ